MTQLNKNNITLDRLINVRHRVEAIAYQIETNL